MSDLRVAIAPFAAAAVVAVLVAAVFHPMLGYGIVGLDVEGHVVENPDIQGIGWENLKQIFSSWCTTSYYPLRSMSFALDYHFWGLNPVGYKLTNILAHLASVLLVFWLALRLFAWPRRVGADPATQTDVLAAVAAAAVFAIHPVVVEPVAWVSGREELLMTLFGLLCVHFHLAARRLSLEGGAAHQIVAWHVLAILACAAACLSNAVGAVIPLLILVIDLLILKKPVFWRILAGTGPLLLIGAAAFSIKKIGEFQDPPGEVAAVSLQRLAMVFNSYYLNLKSLIWPVDLAIFYPPLAPNGFADLDVVLGIAAAALTLAALWTLRREKFLLLGLLWFLLTLAPSSQILVHHVHRADRFLYLPLAGLAVGIAFALRGLAHRAPRRAATMAMAVIGIVALLVAGRLSAAQVRTWQNAPSMWANCVRVSPTNLRFRENYAECLASEGLLARAVEQYERILQAVPHHQMATVRLARLLATADDERIRDPERAFQLAEAAYSRNPVFFRAAADIRTLLAEDQAEAGQFDRAIEGYRYALDKDPANQRAMLQLALLLATCPDEPLRDPQQALSLAERSRLLDEQARREPVQSMLLGMARRLPEPLQAREDSQLIADLRRRLQSWIETRQ